MRNKKAPRVPLPFPHDFDPHDGPCLLCGGELDTGWECTECGADHYHGALLVIDTQGQAKQ